MHRDVSLIIFYRDDKILVQDRRDMSKWGEDYGFFGGQIEAGETPEEAVVRETGEELSFELKDFEFFKRFHHKFRDITLTQYVFVAPCPSFSEFKQKEGQGMILVSEKEGLRLKMPQTSGYRGEYEIMRELFAWLRSRENRGVQKGGGG